VGGAVRDALLGLPAGDIDLATVHPPADARRRIEAAGWKAVPTGIGHGTLTAVSHGARHEVTTLRRDVATDGRRAVVAFTRDWAEDAARRDFTMNALYAHPLSGALSDPTGEGLADLAAGRVRFIGDPLRRIAEDHLRILRFFRFHARFGRGAPDPDALAACALRANDLMALSRERIRDELLKLLVAPRAPETVLLMVDRGILAPVLPEAGDLPGLERLAQREAAQGLAPDPLRRLAALLPADSARLEAIAGRLRLSNAQKQRLAAMAPRLADPPRSPLGRAHAVAELAYWRGAEGARDALLLGQAEPESADLALLDAWVRPRLPVSGGDLVAAGVAPGPKVARRLAELERAWVAQGFGEAPAHRAEHAGEDQSG
jgi:poly(A) polymerase